MAVPSPATARFDRTDFERLPPEAPLAMPTQSLFGRHTRPASDDGRMLVRRLVFFSATAALILTAAPPPLMKFAQGGWTFFEIAAATLFAPLFIGITLWFCSAVAGFISLNGPWAPTALPLRRPRTRTALLAPIHCEAPDAVFARLSAVERGLAERGVADLFDIFVLSDTDVPAIISGEEVAFRAFERHANGAVYYRRRSSKHGRKAGNIGDWVRRFGGAYENMVILDADSVMTAEALVALANRMEDEPDLGIVQTTPTIVGARTLFARYLQFGVSLYGRVSAAGLAWWSGGEGGYWGHNAILRVRAFASCAGLPPLRGAAPFNGDILSHDAIEAALMRRAGWRVVVAPEIEGSYEEAPPTLIEFAKRDRRWCRGNIQHAPVLFAPGLHWVSRLHIIIGIMAYASSPLWLIFLLLGAAIGVEAGPPIRDLTLKPDPDALATIVSIAMITTTLLFGPKLLGAAHILIRPELRRAYGGGWRVLGGSGLEMILSALLAPVLMMAHSRIVFEILRGKDSGWGVQTRDADGLSFSEAANWGGWQACAAVVFVVACVAHPYVAGAGWPILFSLLLAAPLASFTARADAGAIARELGFLTTPEENAPPEVLRRAGVAVAETPYTLDAESAGVLIAPAPPQSGA
ncbi:MAG: glucans biosynthesis glucosyltransferase MdoH [Alphaproteobacteria bacterium]|nr:glucans biosynthesis glucosyltransferase MdoH [Alphaproteobacteria bacterium]